MSARRGLSRRSFLARAALGATGAAFGGVGFSPRLLAASGPFADFRALVNVFLFGGNDAFNMVVPRSAAEYNVYAASRQNLALAQDVLLPIQPENPDGAAYGLHPRMTRLQSLFAAGDAAIVANVGPLIEPVTRAAYYDGSVDLPPQLFSHNDQQDQWQTLKGRQSLATGWAGRIADAMSGVQQRLALNVSTSGTVVFQAGSRTVPYTIGLEGANAYAALVRDDPDVPLGNERRAAFERHLAAGFENVHARALGDVHLRSLATADDVNGALALGAPLATAFPQSLLGRQLAIVARLLGVRDALAMSRQIFFVAVGGFDTHDDQNEDQPDLLGDVSDCLAAFHAATIELGIADQVTTFTQSDFGRTLTSNGDGTDHGWGGHQVVAGGAVRGRRIYGRMPVLEINGADDTTAGRIIPTTSVDQYAATLARWFGVAEADIATVAPNLANFGEQDLGFLA
jgi:uncharacterized protein (DUF1501 family)